MRLIWAGMEPGQRALAAQAARYAVVGVVVTLFQITIYNLLSSVALHWSPFASNIVATGFAMLFGYTIHSRFTFNGHGARDSLARTGGRFVAVNLAGLGVNSLWVWLCITILHGPRWTPSLPMFFVTPGLLFWLNRMWVFG